MGKVKEYTKMGFGLSFGFTVFSIVKALYTIIFLAIGGFLYFNFKNEEEPSKLTPLQIVGIVFTVLGLLPYLDIIIQGIIFGVMRGMDEV